MKAFPNMTGEQGMSLRDYFAAQALPAIYLKINAEWAKEDEFFQHGDQGYPSIDENLVAEFAYSMADAMMEAKKND
jgi:hypothetical protein